MTLRDDYNRDGYAVFKNVFYHPDISHLEGEWKIILDGNPNSYISLLSNSAKAYWIQKSFMSDDLVKCFNELELGNLTIPEQPVLHVMSPNLKIPDGYYGTKAHQDWPSIQGSISMVTVWMALTDAGIGNFPLEVIPGSHLKGFNEGKLNGSVLEIECDDREFIPLECKAGDVVIFSGFTVHRTGEGSGFRVAISQRFDDVDELTFIDRGYPCAQKRVVDREICWKPTVEQVRAVFK